MLFTWGSVVCGFFPPGSHTYIFVSKNSQNARQLLTPPVLQKPKRFHPFLTTDNLKCESYSTLSTRDTFRMRLPRVSQHPHVALAGLQVQDKEPAIPTNAASGSKKHLFYRWQHLVKHGLIITFFIITQLVCDVNSNRFSVFFFSQVVHVPKAS